MRNHIYGSGSRPGEEEAALRDNEDTDLVPGRVDLQCSKTDTIKAALMWRLHQCHVMEGP